MSRDFSGPYPKTAITQGARSWAAWCRRAECDILKRTESSHGGRIIRVDRQSSACAHRQLELELVWEMCKTERSVNERKGPVKAVSETCQSRTWAGKSCSADTQPLFAWGHCFACPVSTLSASVPRVNWSDTELYTSVRIPHQSLRIQLSVS